MNNLRTALGRTIRELRTTAGFSQERFAAAAGVHRTFMGDVERGKANPSLDTLERMANGLGLKVSELVERAETLLGRAEAVGFALASPTPFPAPPPRSSRFHPR